jgi:putative glutamine amidotransferase
MEKIRIQVSGDLGKMENYCAALEQVGAIPVAGYCPSPDLTCAGLLLCGGGDLESTLFGQENHGSDPPDRDRDRAEMALFRAFLQANKPIFGVCRGMQLINVALGGTLIQNLPPESLPFHGRAGHDLVHPIRTAEGLFLHQRYGSVLTVNSFHHQAVDRLGEGLEVAAWSESGFPEAMLHRTAPILAVQFHPERMSYSHRRPDTADGAPIWEYFLSLCRQ